MRQRPVVERALRGWVAIVALAAPWMGACGSSSSGARAPDAGHPGSDAGKPDGNAADSTVADAPVGDGGLPDTAAMDAHADGPLSGDTGGTTDGPLGAPDAGGDDSGPVAIAADTFLSSIGVCAHVTQGVDDPSMSATAMKFAGIRNMRDDGSASTVPAWLTIHQQSGVRMDVLTNQDVAGTIAYAEMLAAQGALLAVEGPNEPNNFPVTYMGQTSGYMTTFLPVAHLQSDLYAAVKADPMLAQIPVFHTSEAGGSEPDNVGLQFLTIPAGSSIAMPDGTRYADYANTHNYICGHSSVLSDNLCWNASDPILNGDWDGMYVEYGHTWHGGFMGYSNADLPTVPRVTTETGWVTTGTNAITLEQQGRLFLNLYLAAFAQGIRYTFVYMLRDDPNQGYWGLFDTSYNPKTSGTYLHNLTTILADTAPFAPGMLEYSIASPPTTVHDLLLQKSTGTFELVVWDERPMGGTDTVTVDLGHSRASVNVYDPTTGTTPVQTLTNVSSAMLMLSDHPMILEL